MSQEFPRRTPLTRERVPIVAAGGGGGNQKSGQWSVVSKTDR